MFSTFLLPKLELHFATSLVRSSNEWVKQYDAVLVGSIKHAIGSPLKLEPLSGGSHSWLPATFLARSRCQGVGALHSTQHCRTE